MSESSQSDAAHRAAARKAKILARGNSGLNKLAQTARGDEAETLYGQDSSVSSPKSPPSPAPNSSTSGPSWAPPPLSTNTTSAQSRAQPQPEPSAEQQAISAQLEAMMSSMFGGGPRGTGASVGAGGGGMPDMQRLMAQMMGVDPGGQNLLGDLDDPAGLGSGGPPMNPFNFSGAGAANGGFPHFPGTGMATQKKSGVERYFPLIHAVSVLVLLVFVVGWWEPRLRSARWAGRALEQGWAGRWAGLAGRKGLWRGVKDESVGGVEGLPIFWAFTTLELILQTTRFFILNSPPRPHSLISTFLPLLPPAISRPLVTGSRYLTLLAQTYRDGCLLIFGVGMAAVVAEWLNGQPFIS